MRSSLVVSGGIIAFTGVALFAALDGDAWLVLIGGGVVVMVAGLRLNELTEKVEPPPGFQFCPYCATLVAEGTARCSHCNGLQEWTPPRPAPAVQPGA